MVGREAVNWERWAIRDWAFGPILAILITLTVAIAFKNIAMAWFMALLTLGAYSGLRYLEQRVPSRVLSVRSSLTIAGVVLFGFVWQVFDSLRTTKASWQELVSTGLIMYVMVLPFALFHFGPGLLGVFSRERNRS
ncbi:MAG: hypothetical protein GC165_05755 [Armatimonadetes bacterium]|nr:hypothetical protein [Armatimonadota bacterium]